VFFDVAFLCIVLSPENQIEINVSHHDFCVVLARGLTMFLRRPFLQTGVPVHLIGIGGPRAPHVFELDRRENLGPLATRNKNLLSLPGWPLKD